MDAVDELKTLGLSAYEAQAYTHLLKLGTSTANVLSRRANVPFGRVYDVLNALVERGLAELTDARPKRYTAVPPALALQSLLTQRKREFAQRYEELTRVAGDLEKKLPRKSRDSSAFYRVLLGDDESRTFLEERIAGAERDLLVSFEFDRYETADDAVFEAVRVALERGVRFRVLLRDADIPYILESPYNALLARTVIPHLGNRLEVRVIEREQVPFAVIDGEKTLVGVKNPLDPTTHFALVFIWDAKFGAALVSRFETLWEESDLDIGAFEEAAAASREAS